jgi:hypothetical protein
LRCSEGGKRCDQYKPKEAKEVEPEADPVPIDVPEPQGNEEPTKEEEPEVATKEELEAYHQQRLAEEEAERAKELEKKTLRTEIAEAKEAGQKACEGIECLRGEFKTFADDLVARMKAKAEEIKADVMGGHGAHDHGEPDDAKSSGDDAPKPLEVHYGNIDDARRLRDKLLACEGCSHLMKQAFLEELQKAYPDLKTADEEGHAKEKAAKPQEGSKGEPQGQEPGSEPEGERADDADDSRATSDSVGGSGDGGLESGGTVRAGDAEAAKPSGPAPAPGAEAAATAATAEPAATEAAESERKCDLGDAFCI